MLVAEHESAVAVGCAAMTSFEDFERWLVENEIPDEEPPEALARWLGEQAGGPPVCFEKVERGDEQILEDRAQRELDPVPSALDPEG